MQDQLVRVERVLPEQQVMLDEHEDGAVSRLEMLVEELVRQNESQNRSGRHGFTVEGLTDKKCVSTEVKTSG